MRYLITLDVNDISINEDELKYRKVQKLFDNVFAIESSDGDLKSVYQEIANIVGSSVNFVVTEISGKSFGNASSVTTSKFNQVLVSI